VNNLAGTSKIATLVSDAAWGNGSVPSTPANQTMIQGRVTKNLVSNINLTSGSPDVTWTAHGLVADTQVRLVTAADQSGSWAGTGITADATKGTGTDVSQVYFVLAAGLTTNTFRIATTPGGSAVTPSGTMPTAPLAYVDNLRLAVDGGTDYPLLNNSGTPWSGFDFTPGTYFWASFTNATESGAVTPGWRAVRDQAQAGGMVAQTLGWAATCFGIASARGLPLNAYEGGQTLLSGGDQGNAFDLTDFLARANRDARMGAATTALLEGWKALGGGLFNYYADIGAPSLFGYWGALENVLQTSTPKFDALAAFSDGLGGGGGGGGGVTRKILSAGSLGFRLHA
jgi:hypothetical protein